MQKKDWAESHLRKLIIDQRKHMWRDDSIEMYSKWMNLSNGMKVIDVGCGLGYLGWTYWKYFGIGGEYVGVDRSSKLLREASGMSDGWAVDGSALFSTGDAYNLPFPDNYADWTMCQTLLMHLKFPEKALAEMVRVTKPGGLIMCKEPDNITATIAGFYSSTGSLSDRDILENHKIMLIYARGRKKLGFGDMAIALRVPKMMSDAGLVNIDSRCNDVSSFVQPPYETAKQKYQIEMAKKFFESDSTEVNKKRGEKEFKDFFLAGGGSLSSYYRYIKRMEKRREESEEMRKQQIFDGTYHSSRGNNSFVCFRAFLPEKERSD